MAPDTDGLAALLVGAAILLAISVPLGIWKLIDIAIWVFQHVHVS